MLCYLCCQWLGGCEIIIRSWWGGRIFILYMEADMEYILDYSCVVFAVAVGWGYLCI